MFELRCSRTVGFRFEDLVMKMAECLFVGDEKALDRWVCMLAIHLFELSLVCSRRQTELASKIVWEQNSCQAF